MSPRPSPRPAVPLTSLEVAYGLALGIDDSVAPLERTPGRSARDELERVLRHALRRAPCLVSFSGGLDSSALLSLAVHVARRDGLPDPVPATLVFPSSGAADERRWQDEVLDHLGLRERLRLPFTDELDAVGPVARRVLGDHGLVWPFNVHFHVPIFEAAAGGSVVTGFGGDELGRASVSLWAERMVAQRRIRSLRDAAFVLYHRSPVALKRTRELARDSAPAADFPYLTGPGRRRVRRALAEEAGPFGFGPLLRRHLWRSRWIQVCRENFQIVADVHGVQVTHPFVEAPVLQALPEPDHAAGLGDRRRIVEHLAGDLLPRAVIDRTTKATFTDPLWTETALGFARQWSGRGLDERLVEPERVRAAWLREGGSILTTTMLQAAWLADHGRVAATT